MGPGEDHVSRIENVAVQCCRGTTGPTQKRHHRRRHLLNHAHASAPPVDTHPGRVKHVCLVDPSAGEAEVQELEGPTRVDARRHTQADASIRSVEDDCAVVRPPQCILAVAWHPLVKRYA